MSGDADGAGSRVARDGGVRVGMGGLQPGHQQDQKDGAQRHPTHHSAGLELAIADQVHDLFASRAIALQKPPAKPPGRSRRNEPQFYQTSRIKLRPEARGRVREIA